MQRVHDNGHVYQGVYEGWYCPRCADFKTERELGPGNTCPIHEIPLERSARRTGSSGSPPSRSSSNASTRSGPTSSPPTSAATRRSRSSSRRPRGRLALAAEAEVGGAAAVGPEQRMYVWFDALLNYYTALSFAREGEDLTDRFWPADLHVIGQGHPQVPRGDLAGAAASPPSSSRRGGCSIHGFLLMGEKKMSKSLGNVLDPFEVIDALRRRRAALLLLPRGQLRPGRLDLDRRLRGRATRPSSPTTTATSPAAMLAMVERYRDGVVPRGRGRRRRSREDFEGAVGALQRLLDRAELTQALEAIWARVRRLNRYVEETQPWDLAKDEADAERLDEVLYNLAEGLRVTTLLLLPYMPGASATLLAALGEDGRELGRARLPRRRPAGRADRAAVPEDRVARVPLPRYAGSEAHAGYGGERLSARSPSGRVSRRAPSSGRARRGSSSAPFRRRLGPPAPGPRCRGGRGRRRRRRAPAP